MMTVHELSRVSGVSIRTLHHYDRIGLLPATEWSPAGYRLYDEAAARRLQQILLFKALEFPLKDIRDILDSPAYDQGKALETQIHLLEMRREHLSNLIDFARGIRGIGVKALNFEAFDTKKIDEYAAEAKRMWGQTEAYREYAAKSKGRSEAKQQALSAEMMGIFAEFGKLKEQSPDCDAAQALVQGLQSHITEHYYTCTDEILSALGRMYAGGGAFTENIDAVGGAGTAEFAARAIQIHCDRR